MNHLQSHLEDAFADPTIYVAEGGGGEVYEIHVAQADLVNEATSSLKDAASFFDPFYVAEEGNSAAPLESAAVYEAQGLAKGQKLLL